MDRRAFLVTAGTAATALAGCGGRASQPDYDVGMSTDSFRPERVTVTVGDPVVWHNTSSHAHTVTAYGDPIPDGADYFASGGYESESAARDGWDSGAGGALYSGDTYEHTFAVPGEYRYFCIPHLRANMIGTVVVEPE
jgi:plastocyanin